MSDEEWYAAVENLYEAVRAYARIEFDGLTRRAIHRLQRIKGSGIYGYDYAYKSLWDEWCHEVQVGPHHLLEFAWEATLAPILDEVINLIPRHSAVLLSAFAAWELEEDYNPDLIGSWWPDGIRQVLQNQLAREAGTRSLDHLGPWKNYS